MKDRHPGWKFRTPFEREVWKVEDIRGTMVTVKRNQTTVTRNVSWFKRAQSHPTTQGNHNPVEGDTDTPHFQATSPGRSQTENSLGLSTPSIPGSNQPTGGGLRNQGQEVTSSEEETRPSQRYNLRPKSAPSQRFRDYVRDF